jgi:hypothetical protein
LKSLNQTSNNNNNNNKIIIINSNEEVYEDVMVQTKGHNASNSYLLGDYINKEVG